MLRTLLKEKSPAMSIYAIIERSTSSGRSESGMFMKIYGEVTVSVKGTRVHPHFVDDFVMALSSL